MIGVPAALVVDPFLDLDSFNKNDQSIGHSSKDFEKMPNRTNSVEFAELDTLPVVWMPDGQAWWYIAPWPRVSTSNPEWRRLSNTHANSHGRRHTKEAFKRLFPDLPPMPTDAITKASGISYLRDANGPIPNDWFENDPGPRTDLRVPFDAQSKELFAFVEELRKGQPSVPPK
jgi:hypothetical protein